MKNTLYILASLLLIITSCTEENIPDLTTCYYVKLTHECYTGNELFPVTDSALVSINVNNTIYEKYTDSLLTANFKDIKPGTATVTINYNGFSEVKYVVELIQDESQNSTITMIPSSGEYSATLTGVVSTECEIPQNINVIITPLDTVSNLISHNGKGVISSVYYENITRKVVNLTNKQFSTTMPATSTGLNYIINIDDFIDPNTNKIYTFKPQQITLYSGKKSVCEIKS
ncbi:MAG: hypothetical protein MJ211_11215 [Bacteroidales bacterium]|nr:hypothetical protein [Bacteroidales bacterium]